MPLADLTGREYGPIDYRLGREKIADFIDASGEDPDRWSESAPPAFAGALLFAVAPTLLRDPDLASHSHGVIHGDQSFTWYRPLTYGLDTIVLGTVSKLRERGGIAFLGFDLSVTDSDGPIVEGSSTFLLSGEASAASGHDEHPEPGPDEGAEATIGAAVLHRTATRRDLVKYAGASRDYNPLHWDHETAVAAGLPGIVVHGLLQSAWILTAACASISGDRPVATARFRYRNPLRPGISVGVTVDRRDDGSLDTAVTDGSVDYVTARVEPSG